MKLDPSISAVITGGASGMGEATARTLASHGVRVALFDLRGTRDARRQGTGRRLLKVHVTSDADVEAGFAKARAANGQERILVNCAGGGGSIKIVGRATSRPAKSSPTRSRTSSES